MTEPLTRRSFLACAATGAGSALAASAASADSKQGGSFHFCLNTSTIRGQKVPIVKEVEIAGRAGYQAIEPWIAELDQYVKEGGNLKDLGKLIHDQGLTVESAIGFAEWIVDDADKRKKGLEQARRDMDMVRQIGGKRIAAPPVGATNQTDLNLLRAAERYRTLLEIGQQIGVIPQVELWGFSKTLGRLGETVLVAVESGHPQACVLTDVYHLYKGGSGYTGLKLLGPQTLQVMHMNDYPDKPDRASITDAHRIYPGDGVAPLVPLLRDLRAIGFRGFLSLEIFNREYWKQDPFEVARRGLEKMQAVVQASQEAPK